MNEYSHVYKLGEHLGKESIINNWKAEKLVKEINVMRKILVVVDESELASGLAAGIRLAMLEATSTEKNTD